MRNTTRHAASAVSLTKCICGSPTEARQVFGKTSYRCNATDTTIAIAAPDGTVNHYVTEYTEI